MVKLTLEFKSADEAIVALGKLVGTPAAPVGPAKGSEPAPTPGAPTTSRKGRSDKGQPRGPYKDKGGEQKGAETGSASAPQVPPVSAPTAGRATVEGDFTRVETEQPLPAANLSPAKDPAAAVSTPVQTQPLPGGKQDDAKLPTDVPTSAAVQAKLEEVFNRFGMASAQSLLADHGVKRVRELAPEKFADFIAAADKLLTPGQQ